MNIFGFLGEIVKPIAKPVVKVFQTDAETRKIKVEGSHKIEKAKIDLKVAKLAAKVEKEKRQSENDLSYDMQVLKNRRETIADEAIIFGFILIMVLTFYPNTQSYMALGWKALNDAPWWFEFGIIGILVSTLGLKDVLRTLLGVASNRVKGPKNKGNSSNIDPFKEVQ